MRMFMDQIGCGFGDYAGFCVFGEIGRSPVSWGIVNCGV